MCFPKSNKTRNLKKKQKKTKKTSILFCNFWTKITIKRTIAINDIVSVCLKSGFCFVDHTSQYTTISNVTCFVT